VRTSPTERDHFTVPTVNMTMNVQTNEASRKDSLSTKPESSSDPVAITTESDAAGGDEKEDLGGADNADKVLLTEAKGDASDKGGQAVVTKTKAKATVQKKKKKAKQFRAKKPKDMPRRPLSGYNIFFKEERARMLAESNEKRGPGETEGEGETKDGKEIVPVKGAKIGFEVMAKTVGKRWKELPEEELARYKAMAKLDMERYRREMDGYHVDLAKRSRLECEEMSRAQQATAAATAPPVAAQQHPDMRTPQPQAESAALGSLDDTMRAQFIGSQAANQMHPQFTQMGYPLLQGSFQAQAPSSGQMQGGMQMSSPGMFDSADGGANTMQQAQLLEALLSANSMSHSQQSQQFQQPQQPQQAMMGGGNLNSQQMSMQQQYFMQQAAQQQAAQQQVLQQQALQRQATNDPSQGNSSFYGNNSGNFMPYGGNDRDDGFGQSQNNRGNY
jgi:hypothetical protein